MRAVLQRVSRASVAVDGKVTGEIGAGLLIFVCAMHGDDSVRAEALAEKIVNLRIFKDDFGKMNRSLRDIGGSALIISQFTLAAELNGNRPGFTSAAPPDVGKPLYETFIHMMQNKSVNLATGVFGADMDVSLNNDGPVTIWMDV